MTEHENYEQFLLEARLAGLKLRMNRAIRDCMDHEKSFMKNDVIIANTITLLNLIAIDPDEVGELSLDGENEGEWEGSQMYRLNQAISDLDYESKIAKWFNLAKKGESGSDRKTWINIQNRVLDHLIRKLNMSNLSDRQIDINHYVWGSVEHDICLRRNGITPTYYTYEHRLMLQLIGQSMIEQYVVDWHNLHGRDE